MIAVDLPDAPAVEGVCVSAVAVRERSRNDSGGARLEERNSDKTQIERAHERKTERERERERQKMALCVCLCERKTDRWEKRGKRRGKGEEER